MVILSIFIIRPILLAIFLGALFAYIFYPLYKYLQKKFKKDALTSFLICLLAFLILVIPTAYFVKALVQESYFIYLLAKQKLAIGLFNDCSNSFCELIGNFGRNEFINSQVKEILRMATDWIIQSGSNFLIALPKMILGLFVVFFTMFYFLKDGRKLLVKIHYYLNNHQKKYSQILMRLKEILHGVIYGYLLIALIQGALGALGFFIFGIPSPLFWGLVMAFLALIPFLGTGFIWVPAAIILLLNGIFQDSMWLVFKGIGLFVYSFLVVGSIDNFLRPKLIGNKAKVHTAIIMAGIFGGVLVFGPLGVLIGPLVLALTAEMINLYLAGRD